MIVVVFLSNSVILLCTLVSSFINILLIKFNMCMILFNVFILIFIIINGNIFNRTVTYVFTSTHVQLKPRAASELEANARIEDMFENVISPLLNTRQADLIQCGRY